LGITITLAKGDFMNIKMACPVHPDVVLFEKNLGRLDFLVFGKTHFCKKCQKSYFEEQCVQYSDRQEDDDEL